MAFIDQGEFGAMKTLSGWEAARCDKHQFRAKITVNTKPLLNIVVITRKKDKKWHTHYRTLSHLAVFCMAFGHLYESC